MSFRAYINAFALIEQTPQLKPSAIITLLVLAYCHNQETGRCDPSVKTIAKRGSISPRAVNDGLRQLAELKLIKITYRQASTGKGRKNLTSRYSFKGAAKQAPPPCKNCSTNHTAKFASTPLQNLQTKVEYRQPSAFDDLAMLLDGGKSE